MMRHLALIASLLLATTAHAQTRARPVPENQPLPATLAQIAADQEDIATVGIMVNLGLGAENPTWAMTRPAKEVFLANLLSDPTPTTVSKQEDRITQQAKNPEPAYKGLTIRLTRIDGRPFREFRIHGGNIYGTRGVLKKDNGRRLEYLVWGTARIRRESVLATRVMPVLTFEHCRMMAQQIVETTPRQCLLPDGDIVLETSTPLTKQALLSLDFNSCLTHGVGLINTFPRRCVSSGGRVYAEPPRVYELPSDAPLASNITDPLDPNLTATTPTTVVPQPGLSGSIVLEPSPTTSVSATMVDISATAATAITTTVTSSTDALITATPAVTTTLPVEVTTGLPAQTISPAEVVAGTPSPTAFPAPQPLTTGGFESTPAPLQPTLPVSDTLYPRTPEARELTSPPITVPGVTPTVPAL